MRQVPNRALGFEKAASSRKRPNTKVVVPTPEGVTLTKEDRKDPLARTRIMYIENKAEGLNGWGRIGRVTVSKTSKTIYYGGKTFQSLKGGGISKSNFYDIETKEEYWISGPKKSGGDRLYGAPGVAINEDVREEYWREIRKQPSRIKETTS